MASTLESDRAMRPFLLNYPGSIDSLKLRENYRFYSGEQQLRPPGTFRSTISRSKLERTTFIDDIHQEPWRIKENGKPESKYAILEGAHDYIQWLFPIREQSGANYGSQPLQGHEISSLKKDERFLDRLCNSYRLMLDFYGMELTSVETGLISRSENYVERYKNLERNSWHNNLRITRILKCLSEFGLEHLNTGFVLHVLNEQSEQPRPDTRQRNERSNSFFIADTRESPNWFDTSLIKRSMDGFWAHCIRGDAERARVADLITKVRTSNENGFKFTRNLYEEVLSRSETGETSST